MQYPFFAFHSLVSILWCILWRQTRVVIIYKPVIQRKKTQHLSIISREILLVISKMKIIISVRIALSNYEITVSRGKFIPFHYIWYVFTVSRAEYKNTAECFLSRYSVCRILQISNISFYTIGQRKSSDNSRQPGGWKRYMHQNIVAQELLLAT